MWAPTIQELLLHRHQSPRHLTLGHPEFSLPLIIPPSLGPLSPQGQRRRPLSRSACYLLWMGTQGRPAPRARIIDRLRQCWLLAFSSYRVVRGRFPSWFASSLNWVIQVSPPSQRLLKEGIPMTLAGSDALTTELSRQAIVPLR